MANELDQLRDEVLRLKAQVAWLTDQVSEQTAERLRRSEKETLRALQRFWAREGRAPRGRELGEMLGINEEAAGQRVRRLRQRGFIGPTGGPGVPGTWLPLRNPDAQGAA